MTGLTSFIGVDDSHGGKAKGLRRLMELGLPVPPGIALDRETVRGLLDGDLGVRTQLTEWLATAPGRLAVRSSAANEDGLQQSFAGVYESVLEVEPSIDAVMESVRRVAASGRSDRTLAYAGSTADTIPVVIQTLVEADVSGVLFSRALDPSGEDCAYVEWVRGLGDALVSGKVTPASVRIPRNVETGRLEPNRVQVGRDLPAPSHLALWTRLAEAVDAGTGSLGWDVEWAIDAREQLWALQMRPATTEVLVPDAHRASGPLPASPGVARGPVRVVDDESHPELEQGEVLVAAITEAEYIPAMKRAAAIVTEEGGLLSHAAIVARELGKPCVVGAANARAKLAGGQVVEVNGTTGTLRQGDLCIGGGTPPEIDWKSVYLYDRGFEVVVDDTPVYVEPTLDGTVAHVDEDTPVDATQRIDAKIRRSFHVAPNIVESDKRIWHREWCRFYQLRTVTFVESLFKAAIAAWDVDDVRGAVALLKRVAVELRTAPGGTTLDRLFWRELGAALHALVAVEVEGHALWASYRASAAWRLRHGVRFPDFLRSGRVTVAGAEPEPDLVRMFACLDTLGQFRNESYRFFSELGVFETQYFRDREELVRQVCEERGLPFDNEDASLAAIYRQTAFRQLDATFSRTVHALAGSACQRET